MTSKETNKGKQGFASMDEDKQREIASKGGRTAHKGEEPNPKQQDEESEETDHDTSEELNELLSIFDEADLMDLDPEEAVSMIDDWHDILNGSEDAELKEIGKGLKQLKKTLTASKPKPAAIAEALTQLGKQTDEYANNAGHGYKTKLHKLGKALSQAGSTLEQEEA